MGCCCNLHGENWFGTKGFSLVQKWSVLLTETPQQPNLLFLAASPLKSPLLFISFRSSSESAQTAPPLLHPHPPAPPPPPLSCVFPASDSSIHEKCDVSRSSVPRWCCEPRTHSSGAMGHRGMADIFQLLYPSFPCFPVFFSSVWTVESSHFMLFFQALPASELW